MAEDKKSLKGGPGRVATWFDFHFARQILQNKDLGSGNSKRGEGERRLICQN